MKIYNKFVESKKEPSNKNDIWFDGSSWKMYKEGMWRPFTISLEQAQALYKYVEGFKLFKIVDTLPQIGEDNTIYLVENKDSIEENSLVEYIYINNTWEEIGKFTPEINLDDYLKIEDSPFKKGTGNNSAVLKGGDNVASNTYSTAFGCNTQANGSYCHAEGFKTKAGILCAHAEGYSTEANGHMCHTEGQGTIANNMAEHAQGKYNKSNSNTIHSVGIGTYVRDRKNAHEIMDDGKHYIYGIGGYDGTNPTTAKSVQEVINELVNKLNEITTSETN